MKLVIHAKFFRNKKGKGSDVSNPVKLLSVICDFEESTVFFFQYNEDKFVFKK